jgi:hypothetical protein
MSLSVSRKDQPRPTATGLTAALTPVGWVADANLPYDEWLRQGSRLGVAGRNASWWVGDWLQYGTHRYGRNYAAAARVTGYDRQTLMNLVYVATRFEVSRRREDLSWSHHAELAALELEEQEYWLDRAGEDALSVRDLREELRAGLPERAARTSAIATRSQSKAARAVKSRPSRSRSTADQVVCPECGHHFKP